MLTISEKIKIINMIEIEKKSIATVAKIYNKNESSIREVLKNKDKIRASFSSAPQTAKVATTIRNKVLLKVENALNLWVEDMTRKHIPIDGKVLQQKALVLYEDMQTQDYTEEEGKSFTASRGWLHRFKTRFNLKNIKMTGESASADHVAAALFPEKFKQIIAEKNYHPKQVFNCDETGLMWKKMPQRTYIHKTAKSAPGFKAIKDRLTLIFCTNAAGHMIKPGLVYRSQNPRALKYKDKACLPVFWQSNRKAWVTAVLFTQWFHQCFITEVKRYLEKEELPFKVLLILDNAPGHPVSLGTEDKNVEVLFLPPNTTSLLQPLDQGVIRCFKAIYIRQVFEMLYTMANECPDIGLMECWKSFTIADAILFIKGAMEELKSETIIACWKNLWNDIVLSSEDTHDINSHLTTIFNIAQKIDGEGFNDITQEELSDYINEEDQVFTNEELEDLVKSSPEASDDEDEGQQEPPAWTLEKFSAIFRTAQTLKEQIVEYDPIMERSIKITRTITEALKPLEDLFIEMKRQKRQLPITMFFEKVDKTIDNAQPSTSFASDLSKQSTANLDLEEDE